VAAFTATTARVDSWIWAVRLVKTRSLATAACRAGHVKVNGERAKAAQPVRIGDEIRVRESGFDTIVTVGAILVKRVSAPVAQASYTDLTPSPPPREEVALAPMRDRGAGRPTKRERRDLERLRGRDDYGTAEYGSDE
jgi:ribosome-associated heat shock protein Hsp15